MQQEQPEAFSETSGVHAGTNMNSVCYSFVAHNDGQDMSIHCVVLKKVVYYLLPSGYLHMYFCLVHCYGYQLSQLLLFHKSFPTF